MRNKTLPISHQKNVSVSPTQKKIQGYMFVSEMIGKTLDSHRHRAALQ